MMLNAAFNRTAIITTLLLALVYAATAGALPRPDGGTPASTTISNHAEASYEDDSGNTFATISRTVFVTVKTVSSLTVTPDETQPSASVGPNETLPRVFRVCNLGNTPDLYTITRAEVNAPSRLSSLYFDVDASGTITSGDTPVTVNESLSPRVQPGFCLNVLAVLETNDAAPQSNITIQLRARSNVEAAVNGRGEDEGTIINTVGNGPRLTSPDSASLPPLKLVNGNPQAIVSPGNPFTYTIAFRNSGDVTARNVLLSDELPASIEYMPATLRLEERGLTDADDADEGTIRNRRIEVRVSEVAPGEVVHVSFQARLTGSAPAGVGVINVATVSGQNVAATSSTTAVVVVDPFGMVFSGRGGAAAPIPGANVAILLDQDGTNPLQIPAGLGFVPNTDNTNPYATDAQGHFSFALRPDQLGSLTAPSRYFMRVTASGYITRMLELSIRPSGTGLFLMTVRALDGQPLAQAGGFELVNEDVEINDLAAVALNIPMFEQRGLEINKAVDRPRAEIGDTLTYRIEVNNPTAATMTNVFVRDQLPESFHYAEGTARLTVGNALDNPIEPQVNGNELIFQIGDLGPGRTARILYRVRIGANAREGRQENLATASGAFPSGERSETRAARAIVEVGGGAFSTRQILMGRVFDDVNRNGTFDKGDEPVAGVRLYLNSGQSVVTDSQGLYNFPSLGDGAQVISLDPVSLPSGYSLTDGGTIAGRSWTRLLRTPLGGGSMLRQNFALVRSGGLLTDAIVTDRLADADKQNAKAGSAGSTEPVKPNPVTSPGTKVMPVTAPASANALQPTAAGKYEMESTETIAPVPAGEVQILSPASNSVVMSPAMQVDARVALNWTVKLEVNGSRISDQNIGTSRLDQKNSVATFSFVGISLRPGQNRVRATAISPEGTPGRTEEITVLGRGPARRLEIVPEQGEVQSGGRAFVLVRVRAFDQWNNPALDDQIAVETSAGQLLLPEATGVEVKEAKPTAAQLNGAGEQVINLEERNRPQTRLIVQLENGEAVFKLLGASAPGDANLFAKAGQAEARSLVRITPELRPTIMVGLAEMSVGKAVPEVSLRGEEGNVRTRLSFFYQGRLWGENMLTLAYDSQRPINRTAGRDRLFQLDPLDRVYPLFGDSSTRFEAAQSNSKLYARVDRRRSYAMFGDYEADMDELSLTGYSRKLTGVKVHLENANGDFVTVTGARPDTAFARDVFPAGSLSLMRLSHAELLPGSETVTLEVRDRRNPEIILSREVLSRSVDYNLNSLNGELFLLRYVSTFDYALNLTQIVVTYEHRAEDFSTSVYTGRAKKNFNQFGLRLGLSTVVQRQADFGTFVLAGIDGEKELPNGGKLSFAYARSQGEFMGSTNGYSVGVDGHDGEAYQVELTQPIDFHEALVRARYSSASEGFFNPFGATVAPGSRRSEVSFEFKPLAKSLFRFGFTNERNRTANVDNSRNTFSAGWDQIVNDRLRFHLGYDRRRFEDAGGGNSIDSQLVTASAEIKLTEKLEVSIKREQNLGEADPTYPTQTTLAATYQYNNWTKFFLTQRLASAPIRPIGDFSQAGFAYSGARRETAIGVESRFGKYTALTGRYQLENGISGTDSFAVIGLQNRLPLSKEFSIELGFERGFHLAGEGESFNSATFGFGWTPTQDFRANARYEFRDRLGRGQMVSLGAAGRLGDGITTLARFQYSRSGFEGRDTTALEAMGALAIRPLKSDRAGLLFSYTHRELEQQGAEDQEAVRDRIDSLATDGYYQMTRDLELYGRFALRFNANSQPGLPYASTLTYLTQGRAQYRLTSRFDWAGEARYIIQPSSGTSRSVYGTELGFWAVPDLRLGVGYNFTLADEPGGLSLSPARRGFYFTISSKLSNLFDLFGTSRAGLSGNAAQPDQPAGEGRKE
ncbi:MAG TPA: SdrD B-like domain-containing protein [Pyrinomonadaceae bacterium]|nr:SdrD B-like domain-containing protein [Pyrinomonadaceae bacterium]